MIQITNRPPVFDPCSIRVPSVADSRSPPESCVFAQSDCESAKSGELLIDRVNHLGMLMLCLPADREYGGTCCAARGLAGRDLHFAPPGTYRFAQSDCDYAKSVEKLLDRLLRCGILGPMFNCRLETRR